MVGQLAYDNVAEEVIKMLAADDVLMRDVGGTLFTYKEGAWSALNNDDTVMLERMVYDAAAEFNFPYAEKSTGVWKTLRARTKKIKADVFDTRPLLALPNGTLDPIENTIGEHDPDHYTTRRVAIPYDPRAKCPEWEKMLARAVQDKDEDTQQAYIDFIQEFFGMGLIGFTQATPRDLRKALILYGHAGTAKTTVADVLREFFHPGEYVGDSVDQISKDFGLERFASARAYISDDAIKANSKPDPNVLKKLITGEPLTATRKYKDKQDFRFKGPILFTTNNKPKVEDESDALFSRTVLLTFDYQFQDDDKKLLKGKTPIQYLKSKGEFPGILNWSISGMLRARENGQYARIAEASESSKVWRAENDPTFDFLSRYGKLDVKSYCSVPLLAKMIAAYSEDEHHKKVSPRSVTNRIRRECGKLIDGTKIEGGDTVRGLKLKEDGVAWMKVAQTRNMIPHGAKWVVNGKAV